MRAEYTPITREPMRCCTTRPFELGPDRDWVVFVHGRAAAPPSGSSSCAPIASTSTCCCSTCGHGQSNQLQQVVKGHYSFRAVTEDILRLLDHLRIPMPTSSAFRSVPFSSATWRSSAPSRSGMVLGGAILRLDIRSQVLVQLGRLGSTSCPTCGSTACSLHHHAAPAPSGVPQPLRARGQKAVPERVQALVPPRHRGESLMRYFRERALPIPPST